MPYSDPQKALERNRKWRAANRDKSRAYSRKWAKNNPDKVYKRCKKWAEENPDKKRATSRKQYYKNQTRAKEYSKKYYEENIDKVKENARIYYIKNKDRYRENERKWVSANREKRNLINARRRARINNASGNISAEEFKIICQYQNNLCAYCEEENILTIDHIIPLSKNGTHDISNIVASCSSCNSTKKNYSLEECLKRQSPYTNASEIISSIEEWKLKILEDG